MCSTAMFFFLVFFLGGGGGEQLHSKGTNRCMHNHQTLPPFFFREKGVACETNCSTALLYKYVLVQNLAYQLVRNRILTKLS